MKVANTSPDYDPRYDRAQTIGGAKHRYAAHDIDYSLDNLERDLDRLLTEGEYPDRQSADWSARKRAAVSSDGTRYRSQTSL